MPMYGNSEQKYISFIFENYKIDKKIDFNIDKNKILDIINQCEYYDLDIKNEYKDEIILYNKSKGYIYHLDEYEIYIDENKYRNYIFKYELELFYKELDDLYWFNWCNLIIEKLNKIDIIKIYFEKYTILNKNCINLIIKYI